MQEFEVIPDVIDKSPEKILTVKFGDKSVNLGNTLTPTEVKNEPEITWESAPSDYYTLLMVDPDAPTKNAPMFREVRHWLVTNIQGSDLSTGEHITEYIGSGPPKHTGLHRYIFLLYKQPNKIDFDIPKTDATSRCHRLRFNTKKFAKKYNLGDAVSGNFYQAEWDSFVDERNKNIKNCDLI